MVKKDEIPSQVLKISEIIKESFEGLVVSDNGTLALFKDVILWTLTWMRDDMENVETWLSEVPNHLRVNLTNHSMIKINKNEIIWTQGNAYPRLPQKGGINEKWATKKPEQMNITYDGATEATCTTGDATLETAA